MMVELVILEAIQQFGKKVIRYGDDVRPMGDWVNLGDTTTFTPYRKK